MKTFLKKLEALFADAALHEEGVPVRRESPLPRRSFAATIEETLVEAAYAEAADYDDIHEALLRERRGPGGDVRPDDCQYGDNDLCLVSA